MKYCIVFVLLVIMQLAPVRSGAEGPAPLQPAPGDKCPVCGMFVAKYPDFLAQVVFADGSYYFFDGVKDMMKFIFDVPKYAPSKTGSQIEQIRATDYYTLKPIDGKKAYYLLGCDVYGPMGKELIPVEKQADAKELADDHGCKSTLEFGAITPEMVAALD